MFIHFKYLLNRKANTKINNMQIKQDIFKLYLYYVLNF